MIRPYAYIYIGLIALSLVGCSPSPSSIQDAIEQTQAAMPTSTSIPTPTEIPFSEMDLEKILINDGDLPTSYVGQQIRDQAPRNFPAMPAPEQIIYQQIDLDDDNAGGVTVLLYDSLSDNDEAYDELVAMLSQNEEATIQDSDVGEKGTMIVEKFPLFLGINEEIIFVRCHALVHIELFSFELSPGVASSYAQRIDKRLGQIVCR